MVILEGQKCYISCGKCKIVNVGVKRADFTNVIYTFTVCLPHRASSNSCNAGAPFGSHFLHASILHRDRHDVTIARIMTSPRSTELRTLPYQSPSNVTTLLPLLY